MTHGHHGTNGKPPGAPASGLGVPLACCWLLVLVTFSLPGRDSPRNTNGMDVIALAKLVVRGGVVLLLARELVRGWGTPRGRVVVWCFTPFAVFTGWALVTVAWSAMPVISAGQWGSLLAQLLLAAVVALKWTGPADTSRLLRHLTLALVVVSGLLVAVHLVDPLLSGLSREDFEEETSNGLVHPTSAGATSSLGLVLLVTARLLWGWRWAKVALVPGILACGVLLELAHSRMALVMAVVVLGVAFVRYTGASLLAGAAVAASVLAAAYLAADPGLTVVEDVNHEITAYMRRGETNEQMEQFNGRGPLWEAIWSEFLHSPLVGQGYFLTTRSGWVYVWNVPGVRTAHNFGLQVLASTGIIGAALFLWALGRPVLAAAGALRGPGEALRLRAFLLLLALWYFGWGQMCESFTGPVQPESVVFYCLLGLAVAQVRRIPTPTPPAEVNGVATAAGVGS